MTRCLVVVLWSFATIAQHPRLDHLKRATVYIVNQVGSGSGFVFEKRGSTFWIMTNHHVVVDGNRPLDQQVVFFSGTAQATIREARIVASNRRMDLAVLEVESHDLEVIPLSLKTTVPDHGYYSGITALGFPFGQMLALESTPAITIRAGISTNVVVDLGDLTAVPLGVNLDPGNSGGPVVDHEGNVVGVAVASILGTGIGFMVSGPDIGRFLAGSIDEVYARTLDRKTQIVVKLFNPYQTRLDVGLFEIRESEFQEGWSFTGKQPHQSLTGTDDLIFDWSAPSFKRERLLLALTVTHPDGRIDRIGPLAIPTRSKAELGLRVEMPTMAMRPEFPMHKPGETFGQGHKQHMAYPIDRIMPARWDTRCLVRMGRHLGLVDLTTGSSMGTVSFPSAQYVLASGAQAAVVYVPEEDRFHVIDLTDWQSLAKRKNPLPGQVLQMTMGRNHGRRLLVLCELKRDSVVVLMDALTQEFVSIHSSGKVSTGQDRVLTSNVNARRVFVNDTSSRGGFRSAIFTYAYRPEKYISVPGGGRAQQGQNGLIFVDSGVIYSSSFQEKRSYYQYQAERILVADHSGQFYLLWDAETQKSDLFTSHAFKQIGSFDLTYAHQSKRGLHLLSNEESEIAVLYCPNDQDVVLKTLAWEDICSKPYLFVTVPPASVYSPGQPYRDTIEVQHDTPIAYRLIKKPTGMTITEDGQLSWLPSMDERGSKKVVIAMTTESGLRSYLKLELVAQNP